MFRKTTLKNGLRIITVPQDSTQAVTVLVLVGTGSKYEKKEVSGISHFLEHMFFKGTKKRPDKMSIAETMDKIGGNYNAFTGEDYTGYFAKVEASHFDLALDWVSDIFLNSTLPKKELAREKGVIIEEINMYYDNPMSHVSLLWNKILYGDQPAGWDIAGTKESVAAISRQELVNYMKSQYVSSNTIVCVAGKINNEPAIKKVKKYFSEIRTSRAERKPKVVDASVDSALTLSSSRGVDASVDSALTLSSSRRVKKQNTPNSILSFRETDQAHFCLGVRGYNIFYPQRYAQELLGIILGGMMSSRLFMKIRERLGLAYYVKTSVDINPDTGYLVTQAGVDNKKIEKAIIAILEEYKKITDKKIPSAELKKVKDYARGQMALTLETSDSKASFYGLQELLQGKILVPEEIYKKIDKITQNDILKIANDIFRPDNLNLALIGPFKDKNKFQRLLKL